METPNDMPDRKPIQRVIISLSDEPLDISQLEAQFPDVSFETVGSGDVGGALNETDAAVVGFVNVRDSLKDASRLVWLQNAGAGVERIVDTGLQERGILLTNGSGVMAANMAEHVVGLMLAFARNLPSVLKSQESRTWRSGIDLTSVFELTGQTVVLIGLGDIGLQIATRLSGFGMTVIGVRRTAPVDGFPANVERVVTIDALAEVLGDADHVISSVPHTPATIGMYDAAMFARFKDGAYFYNVGRGTSVVQPDLVAALESGKLGGAGLDVTDPEPLPADDPLWNAPNVIITGHTSGFTPHFRARVLDLFAENLRRYRAGEELLNVVDFSRGY
jgi:phosphoglycerate dehydrogenase-like enzyme